MIGKVEICFGEKEILPGSLAMFKNSLDSPLI